MVPLMTLRPRALARVEYAVDGDDTIVEVGGDWESFASHNGLRRGYVGNSLWDAVQGPDVQEVWRILLRRVRASGHGVAFLYRCDAPQAERSMRMELHPRAADGVAFRSTVVEERRRPIVELLDQRTPRQGEHVTACGWCGRIRVGMWVDPHVAVTMLGLLDGSTPPVSHGICDRCMRDMCALAGLV
jgi:hypothetical protein